MSIAKYPKYESYRDSGEGWLQQIPCHWEIRKLKQLFHEKKHTVNMGLNCGAISFGEVVEKEDERIPLATKASYQEVLPGEFLVNPLNLNFDLKSLRIALSNIGVVVSAGYIVLQAKVAMERRYFNYLLHRYDVAYMKLLGSGVRQTISYNHIANSQLVSPPLPEQRAIAAFLDEKCSKIDEAVRIKEEQIKLLHERRQILIQQAVTRGLNPDVSMKDSGIGWIGMIPSHWLARKINHIGTVGNGSTPSRSNSSFWQGGIIPWLNSSKVNDFVITSAEQFVTEKAKRECHLPTVSPGDIVMGITGQGRTRGMVAISKIATTINQHLAYIKIKAPEVNVYYLLYFLVASYEWIREQSESGGSTKGAITCDDIKQYVITCPPIPEQRSIVTHIENGSNKINKAISIKEAQISALKEYKTTLINAAVTGKIKVI